MVKYLVHEHDNSAPYTAKVKKEWSCTSAPPICLHGMHTNNLKLYPF